MHFEERNLPKCIKAVFFPDFFFKMCAYPTMYLKFSDLLPKTHLFFCLALKQTAAKATWELKYI